MRLLALESEEWLEGPASDSASLRTEHALFPVTGGGWVATLTPSDGVRALWGEGVRLSGPISVGIEGRGALTGSELLLGSGGWRRRLALPGGEGWVEECGLVPDAVPALVLQWRWCPPPRGSAAAPAPIPLEIRMEQAQGGEGEPTRCMLDPDGPVALMILAPGVDTEGAQRLLHPLRARERQRHNRWRLPEPTGEFCIEIDGVGVPPTLAGALRILDSALLGRGPGTAPARFLGGLSAGAPTFLTGSALEELGRAALGRGRVELARRVLEALAADPSPASLLSRMARPWVAWTGDRGTLRSLAPDGETAMVAALGPEDRRVQAPGGTHLPVLGTAPSRSGPVSLHPTDPTLPHPDQFGDPELPAFADRRTLHAARLVRSWTEGVLGLRPDALVGRLRFAPQLQPEWTGLVLTGLRMGDALIRCEYRRDGEALTFLLRQEGGRVPIHLIFEPWTPLDEVGEVRIGGEIAEVEVIREGTGTRLRCQFPLDPERRITVIGRGIDG